MVTHIIITIIFALTLKSSNGQFTGAVDYTGGHDLVTKSFTLYQGGTLLYKMANPKAITFFISNSGTVFACNEKFLYVYDPTGRVSLIKELNYPNGFAFSPDNSLFFASDINGLFAFANAGELVYEVNPCRLFSSTSDGDEIVTISMDTLYVYEKGILKYQRLLKTLYTRTISIMNEESIKVEEPSVIELFNLNTGEKLEEH